MNLSSTTDHAPGLEACFLAEFGEESYKIEAIQGEIPEYIRGTYYSNGPARFQRGSLRYRNWLDGDGLICALRFGSRDVHLTTRFVRGRKYVEEERLGRATFATFGTRFPGDRMRRGIATESPYNVSVYRYRDQLLAFGEQSIPMALDPVTLETRGSFDFDRQLNEMTPFSAHPKIDCDSGELFNYGMSFSEREPCLNYFRFDATGTLACRSRIPIDFPCSIHDFAVSQQHAVFYLSPYNLDVAKLMREGSATIDALIWQPELGSRLLILDRQTGLEKARVNIEGRYCLHTINCFDDGQRLWFDVIEFERPLYDQYQVLPGLFSNVPLGGPVRYSIDLPTASVVRRDESDYRQSPDFPSIDPRSHGGACDDCWMLGIAASGRPGRKFFDQLVHVQWSSHKVDCYEAERGWFLAGEPVFVGEPHRHNSGSIIVQLVCPTENRHEFALFAAFDVSAGPVARIPLQRPLRLGFHACFEWHAE